MILALPERIGFEPGLLDLLRELADHLSRLIRRAQFARWTKQDGLEARLVGKSQAMVTIEDLVEKFARSNCPVLITGETGTGKELIARAIHFNSPRKYKAFVAVNCGAFASDDLLASELFGHVKGAFTDAKSDKKGKFELADGGTIFLDEVSCMRPAMQVALLRVLRYGEIQKVGDDNATRKVNVRVVAASNQDLKRLIEEGRFREDVYYRLAVAEIKVPPLRDRKEDIPLLVEYFIEKFSRRENLEPKSVSSEAMKALMSYSWPNNIAGLENIIWSALLAEGRQIELEDLPEELRLDHGPLDPIGMNCAWRAESVYRKIIEDRGSFWELAYKPFKKHDITRNDIMKLITIALDQANGSYRKAAHILGIQDKRSYKKFMAFLVNNRCIIKAKRDKKF